MTQTWIVYIKDRCYTEVELVSTEQLSERIKQLSDTPNVSKIEVKRKDN